MSVRSFSADMVPVGESDGREMVLPDDSLACVAWSRARLAWRPASDEVPMLRWVIRKAEDMGGWLLPPADEAGGVDQRVEGLVDGREEAAGGVVGVLELQHVRHLLVEVDATGGLPGGVDVLHDRGLHVDPAVDGLRLDAELDHQLLVVVADAGELGD